MIFTSTIERKIRSEIIHWLRDIDDGTDYKRGVEQCSRRIFDIIDAEKKLCNVDFRQIGARKAWGTMLMVYRYIRSGDRSKAIKILEQQVKFLKTKGLGI